MFQPVVINAKKEVIINPTNPLRNICFLSVKDTSTSQGTTTQVTEPLSTSGGYSQFLVDFSSSFFQFAPNSQFAVYELETFNSTTLQQTLENLSSEYGIFAMGDSLGDSAGLETIFKALDNPNNPQMFLVGTKKSFVDSSIETLAQSFNGLSNTNLCYESATNNSVVGAISGLIASPKFDLTSINPISPMIYTSLQGWKFNAITNQQEEVAINNNITYIRELIKIPSLFNMTNSDGNQFLYWYSYKYLNMMIKNGLTEYMMNSANGNRPLQFNQQGIDKLNSNIVSTLKNAKSFGLIDDFGIGANNVFSEKNIINSIPFSDYILNNPSEYANGIYNGFSFAVQIGRYFKQVVLDVTIM